MIRHPYLIRFFENHRLDKMHYKNHLRNQSYFSSFSSHYSPRFLYFLAFKKEGSLGQHSLTSCQFSLIMQICHDRKGTPIYLKKDCTRE